MQCETENMLLEVEVSKLFYIYNIQSAENNITVKEIV